LRQEHAIYPAALAAFATGKPVGSPDPEACLTNPPAWGTA
jgi:phosphoribosylglycinamide formyltransferase-1